MENSITCPCSLKIGGMGEIALMPKKDHSHCLCLIAVESQNNVCPCSFYCHKTQKKSVWKHSTLWGLVDITGDKLKGDPKNLIWVVE